MCVCWCFKTIVRAYFCRDYTCKDGIEGGENREDNMLFRLSWCFSIFESLRLHPSCVLAGFLLRVWESWKKRREEIRYTYERVQPRDGSVGCRQILPLISRVRLQFLVERIARACKSSNFSTLKSFLYFSSWGQKTSSGFYKNARNSWKKNHKLPILSFILSWRFSVPYNQVQLSTLRWVCQIHRLSLQVELYFVGQNSSLVLALLILVSVENRKSEIF